MAAFPGIGASILTPGLARFRAISSDKLTILLTLTPGAGCNSYLVMAGPLLTWSTLADIPKLIKVSSNSLALFLTLAPLNLDSFAASGSSNKVIGGKE